MAHVAVHNAQGPRQLVIRACLVAAVQHLPGSTGQGPWPARLVDLGELHLGEHLVNPAGASWASTWSTWASSRYSWPLRLIQGPRTRARFTGQLRQLARAAGARRKKTGQGPV